MAFTNITENTRNSYNINFDSKDNIYIEWNVTKYIHTANSYLMIQMMYSINSSSFWYLYWHINSANTNAESGLDYYYNNRNNWTEKILNANLSQYTTGHFGIAINFSSNTVYFYANGSMVSSVNISAYTSLSNFTSCFLGGTIRNNLSLGPMPIFRNEFSVLPSGYSVPGDFLHKEAMKDKEEYYYTYK